MAKSEFLVVARQKLPYLNDLLAKNEYVTGKLSYVDVVLYDFCLVLSVFAPELLEEHPNIKRHFKAIDSLPAIKNYRNGKGKGKLLSFRIRKKLRTNLSHFRCLEGENVSFAKRCVSRKNLSSCSLGNK